MKLNSIALALVSAIALTACGGSGSNLSAVNNSDQAKSVSHNNLHSNKKINISPEPSEERKNNQDKNNSLNESLNQGGLYKQFSPTPQTQDDNPVSQGDIKDNGSGYKGVYVAVVPENGEPATLETKDFNTVIINGKEIKLEPLTGDGSSGNSYMLGSGDEDEVKLENVRYGFIYADNYFIVAQGEATPAEDMPFTIKDIYYKGNAVYADDNGDRLQFAESSFTVDLISKELEGVIYGQENLHAPNIEIKAKIDGNHFAGDYNEFHTQGQFYGAEAAELAGTFVKNDNTVAGAFGAKKEKE